MRMYHKGVPYFGEYWSLTAGDNLGETVLVGDDSVGFSAYSGETLRAGRGGDLSDGGISVPPDGLWLSCPDNSGYLYATVSIERPLRIRTFAAQSLSNDPIWEMEIPLIGPSAALTINTFDAKHVFFSQSNYETVIHSVAFGTF